jgi:excisionase family DNA binding protein
VGKLRRLEADGGGRGLPGDVKHLSWVAERLDISTSTAYRLAMAGKLPGCFKVGRQWRVSVARFEREVDGFDPGDGPEAA